MENSELKVETVSAITDTKLSVTLSQAVDAAAKENFSIPGLTVVSATLDEDKKTVVLQTSVAEAGKEYTLTVSGLKIDAETQEDFTKKFTMPEATSLYQPTLKIAGERTVLKADGSDSTLVTFELTDANGNIVTDASNVEVAFTTTFGNFAEKRVTLQNGVASALLISEALPADKTALINATVVEASNRNLINLKAERNILMSPNPDAGLEEKVGATLTDVVVEQADRVLLYFNKDVTPEQFSSNGFAYDASKATVNVRNAANNDTTGGTPITPIGYKAVEGNSKALYAILPTSNVLTDNTNVAVDFQDLTGTVATNATKMTKITDARKPAMLGIAREGLRKIVVTFSEPVVSGVTADGDSAQLLENWGIDGYLLNDARYGVAGNQAKAEVGTFNTITGEDSRHIVTITLGKNAAGDNIYFTPGTHSLQGSNIGDWANRSDVGNNVMNTQTLDFVIPQDNEVPTAEVLVQSPEQYVVTFNKELVKTLTTAELKLQRYNKTTSAWEDVPTGYTGISAPGKQDLKIVLIPGTDNAKYKVEVEQDWTEFYNTVSTNKNYYNDNYRLHIATDQVTAAANGKKNVEINLPLGGAMTSPDVTSPKINTIEKHTTGGYKVTMSEPVKMPTGGDTLYTLAQGQTSIPQPTAQFIKKDGSETIPANTIDTVLDAYDTQLHVTPSKTLTPGEWTLVVRSISDDVGNTAESLTKDFTVEGTPITESAFKVLWATADTNYSDGFTTRQVAPHATSQDAIYVKFNKAVKVTGEHVNALTTSNYTLNGAPLPQGTKIVADIKNYDDKDQVVDSVTIILPDGTLTNAETTVVTISEFIESATGEKLTNGGQKKLSYNYADANGGQADAIASVDTKDELVAALKNDKVRSIKLTDNITANIDVNRAVNIDLGSKTLTGDISYNTTDGAIIELGNGTVTGDLTVDTPNADFTVGTGLTVSGTTTIKDVLSSTFTNKGTLADVVIEDSNGTSFVNEGTVSGTVTVDTTGEVTLGGTTALTDVKVKKAAKITLADDATVTITELAADAEVENADGTPVDANVTAQAEVNAIAAGITSIEAPAQDAKALDLPIVPNGYSVAIKSSSVDTVIALNGTITPPEEATTVNVVLTVSKDGTEHKADTKSIAVVVPAKTADPVEAPDTGVKATAGTFAGGADEEVDPAVAAEYSFKVTAGTKAGTLTLANVANAGVVVNLEENATLEDIVTAIKTEVEKADGSLYHVTVDKETGAVTLTANTAGVITDAPTAKVTDSDVTVTDLNEDTAGKKEIVTPAKEATADLTVTTGAVESGKVEVLIGEVVVGTITVSAGDSASNVASKIADLTITGYTVAANAAVVTFEANEAGKATNGLEVSLRDVK